MMTEKKYTLCLTGRQGLFVGGVKEVVSFDEDGAVLVTEMGELEIGGREIRILDLDRESGEIQICGRVDSMTFATEDSQRKKGLRARLFG